MPSDEFRHPACSHAVHYQVMISTISDHHYLRVAASEEGEVGVGLAERQHGASGVVAVDGAEVEGPDPLVGLQSLKKQNGFGPTLDFGWLRSTRTVKELCLP